MLEELMQLWPYVIGYLFAIFVAQEFISRITDQMWLAIGQTQQETQVQWQSTVIGWIERVLYVAFFQAGNPEFIGFWLALKVAGQWDRWTKKREFFNVFLIYNALSVAYGAVGSKIIDWFAAREWFTGISVPAIFILASLALLRFIKRKTGAAEPAS